MRSFGDFIEYFTHQKLSSSRVLLLRGKFPGTNARAGGGRKERDPDAVPEWQLVKSVEWIGLVKKKKRNKRKRRRRRSKE